jgi:hypothetical protein
MAHVRWRDLRHGGISADWRAAGIDRDSRRKPEPCEARTSSSPAWVGAGSFCQWKQWLGLMPLNAWPELLEWTFKQVNAVVRHVPYEMDTQAKVAGGCWIWARPCDVLR